MKTKKNKPSTASRFDTEEKKNDNVQSYILQTHFQCWEKKNNKNNSVMINQRIRQEVIVWKKNAQGR